MSSAIARRLGVLVLSCFAAHAGADTPQDAQTRAADFATCAAYYFNAVNVTPVKDYETVYGAGERAFNEGLKLVGRTQLDELMARSSGEMMKLMGSNWNNFPTVEQRYNADCDALMGGVPLE